MCNMRKEPQEIVMEGLIIHEWRGLVHEGDLRAIAGVFTSNGKTETQFTLVAYPVGITAL